jgi:hypothetical protein
VKRDLRDRIIKALEDRHDGMWDTKTGFKAVCAHCDPEHWAANVADIVIEEIKREG